MLVMGRSILEVDPALCQEKEKDDQQKHDMNKAALKQLTVSDLDDFFVKSWCVITGFGVSMSQTKSWCFYEPCVVCCGCDTFWWVFLFALKAIGTIITLRISDHISGEISKSWSFPKKDKWKSDLLEASIFFSGGVGVGQ